MHNHKGLPLSLGFFCTIFFLLTLTMGCGGNYTPKPRGFLRMDLPAKKYQVFDTVGPYSFEYPQYAQVIHEPPEKNQKSVQRFNVGFGNLNGTIHCTYVPLSGNLDTLIEDAVDFVYRHVPKATTIAKTSIIREEDQVFGMVFNIKGKSVASTYQFYLTDSTRHFLRGALYLNTIPDNDSLKPVIDFLKQDVDHMMQTLRWK